MRYTPRKHQQLAGDFLREHNRAALLLDMGLGKTVITLTRLSELFADFAIEKALVIAPKRVAEDTWTREAAKWDHLAGLRVVPVLGDQKHRLAALASAGDIYVINRENVQWLVETCGKRWDFDAIIIDELSSFKSPKAKRWRCLKRVAKLARIVWGLTGTPAGNGYIDLWPEMFLIDGGERLGRTLGEFRTKWFSPGAHKGNIVYEWRLKPGAKEDIDRRLSDICLSMSKEDWLTLPPVVHNTVAVRMDAKERKLYDQLRRDCVLPLLGGELADMKNFDQAIVGGTAATLSGKLLQMANGSVYDEDGGVVHIHDRKLDALADIAEEAHGQSLLVFYSYRHDIDRIRERFPQAVEIGGSETIRAWNDGEIPMLLCHPASAGHGLNLQQGGHIIVWFGLPWSLELYQQANARLNRMGQGQSVIVHHVVCEGTLDEKVLSALTEKDAVQKGLLDALKGYAYDTIRDLS